MIRSAPPPTDNFTLWNTHHRGCLTSECSMPWQAELNPKVSRRGEAEEAGYVDDDDDDEPPSRSSRKRRRL